MAQSLKARFDGNSQEVLRDAELYGRNYAMDKWNVKDYLAFCRYLASETGNPNFGLNPKFNPAYGQDLGEQIITAFRSYVLRSEAKNRHLEGRIEVLEWQLKEKGIENRDKAGPLLQELSAGIT